MRLRHSGDLRRAHRVEVVRCFYGGEPRTRQELASRLGLSVATIGTITGELTKAGFLKETAGPRTGGRPAAQLTLRGGGSLVVGVDVTETHVTAELFDQAMARLARKRVPVLESAPDAVAERVLEAVGAVRRQVYEAPVRAVGVSLPEHGFRALLERRCDVPVVFDQPVKALTLAEQTFGAARDQDDVIVADLGTGAGLGVVSGGRLLRGATNSAGEWDTPSCTPTHWWACSTAARISCPVTGRQRWHGSRKPCGKATPRRWRRSAGSAVRSVRPSPTPLPCSTPG
ncbi:ROK family protein [Lentzea sp. NPDC006480]|uniref:ROK family protein n=1 Tax=Lentzea sp. NPDC006480 TaxID=3157176 RepID=UPI0033B53344